MIKLKTLGELYAEAEDRAAAAVARMTQTRKRHKWLKFEVQYEREVRKGQRLLRAMDR